MTSLFFHLNIYCGTHQNWLRGYSRIEIFTGHTSMTFIHQDLWYGKLVPSSHQRVKLSRANNQNWKGIPASTGLREE